MQEYQETLQHFQFWLVTVLRVFFQFVVTEKEDKDYLWCITKDFLPLYIAAVVVTVYLDPTYYSVDEMCRKSFIILKISSSKQKLFI